jgi:hypothetical protein
LPDIGMDVANAAMRLDTRRQVGLSLAGSGRLSGGFRGRVIAMSEAAPLAGCSLQVTSASLAVSIAAASRS